MRSMIKFILFTQIQAKYKAAFSRNSEVIPLTEEQKTAIVRAHNVYSGVLQQILIFSYKLEQ